MSERPKTIQILLKNGDIDGIMIIENSLWNSGILYSAPKASVPDLLELGACNKYGIYILLSKDKVYVGQSTDLEKRLSQHMIGKDWWESTVILTTKDDGLTCSDIDYLEYMLIDKAFSLKTLDCDNKKKGNPPKVTVFRKSFLDEYLKEAIFTMELISINVFGDSNSKYKGHNGTDRKALIDTLDVCEKLSDGNRAKEAAIQFLKNSGIEIKTANNYAHIQPDNTFWINPNVANINEDWDIILNNNKKMELIVIRISKGTFVIESDDLKGLKVRKDNPRKINLRISADTLIDSVSKTDFSKNVIKRIKY